MIDNAALRERLIPYQPGNGGSDRGAATRLFQFVLAIVTLFGFAFSLTCLYLAMRGVMKLGGFVARGGPYAITHPAPGWMWILPVSIIALLICAGANSSLARKVGGLSAGALLWPATFLALGWNFLEFAFKSGEGQGVVVAWLICGVVFVVMGGIPIPIMISLYLKSRRPLAGSSSGQPAAGRAMRTAVLVILEIAILAAGIYAADRYVTTLSGQAERTAGSAMEPGRPVPPAVASERRGSLSLPGMPNSTRVVITFEHNTLELLPADGKIFYNGRAYQDPGRLPDQARQVLVTIKDWLGFLLAD